MQKNLHPTWFFDTKVFCDGLLIMVTSSTKSTLTVDSWSGNHPAYKNQDFLAAQKNPNVQLFLNQSKTKKSSY